MKTYLDLITNNQGTKGHLHKGFGEINKDTIRWLFPDTYLWNRK